MSPLAGLICSVESPSGHRPSGRPTLHSHCISFGALNGERVSRPAAEHVSPAFADCASAPLPSACQCQSEADAWPARRPCARFPTEGAARARRKIKTLSPWLRPRLPCEAFLEMVIRLPGLRQLAATPEHEPGALSALRIRLAAKYSAIVAAGNRTNSYAPPERPVERAAHKKPSSLRAETMMSVVTERSLLGHKSLRFRLRCVFSVRFS